MSDDHKLGIFGIAALLVLLLTITICVTVYNIRDTEARNHAVRIEGK